MKQTYFATSYTRKFCKHNHNLGRTVCACSINPLCIHSITSLWHQHMLSCQIQSYRHHVTETNVLQSSHLWEETAGVPSRLLFYPIKEFMAWQINFICLFLLLKGNAVSQKLLTQRAVALPKSYLSVATAEWGTGEFSEMIPIQHWSI